MGEFHLTYSQGLKPWEYVNDRYHQTVVSRQTEYFRVYGAV